MAAIKIFLASSSELKNLRIDFDLFIRRKNDYLRDQNINLQVILWENFNNAVSPTRLQDEYNNAIETSDLFVSVFKTKAGMFTVEEFNHAFEHFKVKQRPLVYTYFLNEAGNEEFSLQDFKLKLRNMGHYITMCTNEQDFLLQFSEELHRYLSIKKVRSNLKEDMNQIVRNISQKGDKNVQIGTIEGDATFNL